MRVSVSQLKRIIREASQGQYLLEGSPGQDHLSDASSAMAALAPALDRAIDALAEAYQSGALPEHPPERGPGGAVYGRDSAYTEDAVRDLLDALDAAKAQLSVVRDMF